MRSVIVMISVVSVMMISVVSSKEALSATFKNLDFESAVVQGADYPWQIDAAAALPFWTVREDNVVRTQLWYTTFPLDTTVELLLSSSNPNIGSPIQGRYSVSLCKANGYGTPSISQVGDVPLGTRSIQFLIHPPIYGDAMFFGRPTVSINGQTIDVFELSSSGDVITMVGDVSSFAGTTATLTIQAQARLYNFFDLDAISFSSTPAPEPSTIGLFGFGALGLLAFAWRRRRAI